MVLHVSDTASNRRDQIANYAEILRNASAREGVFREVYRGNKKYKTLIEIAECLEWDAKRVATVGKPLARGEKLFEQDRVCIKGKMHTVYRKIDFVEANKRKILTLANDKRKLEGYQTKTNPKGAVAGQKIVVRVPFRVRVKFISINDVDQFSKVRRIKSVPSKLATERLPEKQVKAGILRLLEEVKLPKDWPGETNDIFTTKLRIRGRDLRGAFALKGPSVKGPLVPGMMGKNGDQIPRLFDSPSDAFFVQYEGEVKESVLALMEKLATARALFGREILFGVIDREGTYRLRLAYPTAFKGD